MPDAGVAIACRSSLLLGLLDRKHTPQLQVVRIIPSYGTSLNQQAVTDSNLVWPRLAFVLCPRMYMLPALVKPFSCQ